MTTVATHVEERAQLAVTRAGDDHGDTSGRRREVGARLGRASRVTHVLPAAPEDPFFLAPQHLGIAVPAPRKSPLHAGTVVSTPWRLHVPAGFPSSSSSW